MKRLLIFVFVACMIATFALPAFAADTEAVIVPASNPDAILNLFPAIFESIISIFQAPPITYLLGVLLLAFIVLFFKMITHYR